MKIFVVAVSILIGLVSTNLKADLITNFTDFTGNATSNFVSVVSVDSSTSLHWTTTSLVDLGTGNGALSSNVQHTNNRLASNSTVGSTTVSNVGLNPSVGTTLFLSNNRENPNSTNSPPPANTYFEFTVTPDAGWTFDFTGQFATVNTMAFSSVGVGSGGNWELLANTGTGFGSLGVQNGAVASSANLVIGQAVSFDLTSLGAQLGPVSFRLNPIATSAFNGASTQRSIAFDNLQINAIVTAVPEPSSITLVALTAVGMVLRRRRA